MGKFDGVLLASDYDDTLYGTTLTVTPKTKEAIAYFQSEGGKFTIATGRAYPTFTPQIGREHLILNAPVVLSNGAAVFDYEAGKYLRQTHLRPEAREDMQELSDLFPALGLEFYHNEDIFILRPNRFTDSHMKRVEVPWKEIERADQVETPYVKLIIEAPHEDLLQAQAHVLAKWPEHYEAIFSNVHLLEITLKGATKGGMVAWLAEYLHILPQNLYCVGDSPNDLSMLKVSAVPYAPANCTQDLKDFGAVILPDRDNDPIAALIEDLDKRY